MVDVSSSPETFRIDLRLGGALVTSFDVAPEVARALTLGLIEHARSVAPDQSSELPPARFVDFMLCKEPGKLGATREELPVECDRWELRAKRSAAQRGAYITRKRNERVRYGHISEGAVENS
ncbi:MAG: hypothetical protein P4L33_10505 [Capsulimonadaceae bacterium]|nr:hypothetical protein [Capsulimonadaceae bacterium]